MFGADATTTAPAAMELGMALALSWLGLLPPLLWACHGKAKKKEKAAPTNEPVVKIEQLKPREFSKNEKEQMIAEGQLTAKKTDYPTMDDVVSDWESVDDKEKDSKKSSKKKKKGGAKSDAHSKNSGAGKKKKKKDKGSKAGDKKADAKPNKDNADDAASNKSQFSQASAYKGADNDHFMLP